MKKIRVFFVILIVTAFCGCSGSDTYRGLWKATDLNGERLEILFDAKSFSTKDSTGTKKNFEYTQNSVSIENSVRTYGIKLRDGRTYIIHFPLAGDQSKGIIKDDNDRPIYAIARDQYITYQDMYKLK